MKGLKITLLAAVTLLTVGETAKATEFGQTHVDLGYLGILGGFAPPAGQLYGRADTNVVFSNTLNDRNGNPVKENLGPLGQYPIKYLGNTTAEVLSFAYVLPFLNAHIGIAAYTFYAGARAEVQDAILGRVSGSGESISGLGDTTVIPSSSTSRSRAPSSTSTCPQPSSRPRPAPTTGAIRSEPTSASTI